MMNTAHRLQAVAGYRLTGRSDLGNKVSHACSVMIRSRAVSRRRVERSPDAARPQATPTPHAVAHAPARSPVVRSSHASAPDVSPSIIQNSHDMVRVRSARPRRHDLCGLRTARGSRLSSPIEPAPSRSGRRPRRPPHAISHGTRPYSEFFLRAALASDISSCQKKCTAD